MTGMATKKKPDADRHKPSRMIRIPERIAQLLEELAEEELGSSLAEQVRKALREYLQRNGKHSPPGGSQK